MRIFPVDFDYNIRLLMAFTFLSTSIRGVWDQNVMSLFVYLITDNSSVLVGVLAGVSGITQVLLTLSLATFADKYPRKLIMKLGGSCSLIGIALTSYAVVVGSYKVLVLSMVVWGAFWAFTFPTTGALIADSVAKGNRSRVYSWNWTIRFLGNAMGPLVSILLFATLGNNWNIVECKVVMLIGLGLFIAPSSLLFRFKDPPSAIEENLAKPVLEKYDECDETNNRNNNNSIKEENGNANCNSSYDDEEEASVQSNSTVSSLKTRECSGFLGIQSIPYVPAMIALADVISGLGSGMTVKFFPIFFAHDLHMRPVEVSGLFLVSYLVLSAVSTGIQHLSKYMGRMYTTILAKLLGISFFLLLILLYMNNAGIWLILPSYIIRTSFMNSTKPLTTSAIMDTIPASQRLRWNSLESVNHASWAGSAVFGGYLIDRYGMKVNFMVTIIMQVMAVVPVICVCGLVPHESGAKSFGELWKRVLNSKKAGRSGNVPVTPIGLGVLPSWLSDWLTKLLSTPDDSKKGVYSSLSQTELTEKDESV